MSVHDYEDEDDLTSTTPSNKTNNDDKESQGDDSLSRKETKAVVRSKTIFLVAIVLASFFGGMATFRYTRNEEYDDFTSKFEDLAIEVVALSHQEASNIFKAVHSFSSTTTSYAIDTNVTWPFLTLPHFEIRGQNNNQITLALQLTLAPLLNDENKEYWEEYSVQNQGWIKEGLQAAEEFDLGHHVQGTTPLAPINERIWRFEESDKGKPIWQTGSTEDGQGRFAPVWQQAPFPRETGIVNYDLLSHPVFVRIYHGMNETRLPVLSEVTDLSFLYGSSIKDDFDHPHSFLLQPVYRTFKNDDIVAFIVAVLPWDGYFSNLLPGDMGKLVVVLHDTCDDHFTYQINGAKAVYVGKGDLHDPAYDDLAITTEFTPFLPHEFSDLHKHCEYDLRIYPSAEMEAEFRTSNPAIYTGLVMIVFFLTTMSFVLYDCLVQRRQRRVAAAAKRTHNIVSSLFPSNVRDRILEEAEEQAQFEMKNARQRSSVFTIAPKAKIRTFLNEGQGQDITETKPIADLFPNCTVLFADIVGFTAWSSVREPAQVFTLLETLYQSFDDIAKARRVFKVETIGDCYVAVAGLPDPRRDHAVVMARYARDCLISMNDLVKRLEVSLGPDTGDLSMRVGLHSGPVTAGVLRGDKSRFQLFGDTVNTASRVESTGVANRVHLSKETAELLIGAGRSHWVIERAEKVQAKGKGAIQTYWLDAKLPSGSSQICSEGGDTVDGNRIPSKPMSSGKGKSDVRTETIAGERQQRLVDWNTEILGRLLKQIIARNSNQASAHTSARWAQVRRDLSGTALGRTVLDEVREIIHLPGFDGRADEIQREHESTPLDETIFAELHEYVNIIGTMYNDNPFHNFEHASHVAMSVVKLLSRVVAPDILENASAEAFSSLLHDYTYGITSDPLTQFACVFAALIHDVDHPGVPNSQLVKESVPIAIAYKNKSVAEQNSVDVAWRLLMDDGFAHLRDALCPTDDDVCRFRQLVVNSVMATDVVDVELKNLRNSRWDRAFSDHDECDDSIGINEMAEVRENINRKATIVIEHLIQASDVSHTMQHWHVYRKWNERLFMEMLLAYKQGRADRDPTEFWYNGELKFLDFYVIPLAKKLAECGVFGVSSDEYLNYALSNRLEWEARGQETVAMMIEKYHDLTFETETTTRAEI